MRLLKERERDEEHWDHLLVEREVVEDEAGPIEAEGQSHQEEELEEIPCMSCERIFPNKKRFYSHYWRAHKDPGVCSKCGKCWSSARKLRRHMEAAHPEDPPLVCPGCGKSFKIPACLRIH